MAAPNYLPGHVKRPGSPTFNVKPVRSPPKDHVVYFVQAECGLIKIGTTGTIAWRLESLRGQSPVALTLLATTPGRRTEEFAYHARFAEHRLHGEWFSPHPDILAEIERLKELGA